MSRLIQSIPPTKAAPFKIWLSRVCTERIDETFWLTQKSIAELFGTTVANINIHIYNIFEEGELEEKSTIKDSLIVQTKGNREVSRKIRFHNLDMIIAIGYRVNSKKATHFRQLATNTLKEYIQKGFVLNDEMLKNGRPFGRDYFDELLERIREIRASERRAYQKIADIFEQCSYDYDKNSNLTKNFYSFVQNMLHFAITGKTADIKGIIFEGKITFTKDMIADFYVLSKNTSSS